MLTLPKVACIISIILIRKSNDVLHKTQRVETQFYLESQIPQGKENKTEGVRLFDFGTCYETLMF